MMSIGNGHYDRYGVYHPTEEEWALEDFIRNWYIAGPAFLIVNTIVFTCLSMLFGHHLVFFGIGAVIQILFSWSLTFPENKPGYRSSSLQLQSGPKFISNNH
jgi:hypothetical protein